MYGYNGAIFSNSMTGLMASLDTIFPMVFGSVLMGLMATWMIYMTMEPLKTEDANYNQALLGRSLTLFSVMGIVTFVGLMAIAFGTIYVMSVFS